MLFMDDIDMELLDCSPFETFYQAVKAAEATDATPRNHEFDLGYGRDMRLRPLPGGYLYYDIDVLFLEDNERRQTQLLAALRANTALSHERTTALRFSQNDDRLVLCGKLFAYGVEDRVVCAQLEKKLEEADRLASAVSSIVD